MVVVVELWFVESGVASEGDGQMVFFAMWVHGKKIVLCVVFQQYGIIEYSICLIIKILS